MDKIYEKVELLNCPLCNGTGVLEEESSSWFYVCCLDCGCHTAEILYRNKAEKFESASKAAHLWNIGKVLSSTPSD